MDNHAKILQYRGKWPYLNIGIDDNEIILMLVFFITYDSLLI